MEYLIKGWFFVIVGVILIGVGGVISTWGWDNINKKGQRDTLVFALAREFFINNVYLLTSPLRLKLDAKDIGAKHDAYPRFEISAVNTVLTSSLLTDRDLNLLLINYGQFAKICNNAFSLLDEQLIRTGITAEKRTEEYKRILNEFQPLHRFRGFHEDIRQILIKRYPNQFNKALEFAKKQQEMVEKADSGFTEMSKD